MQELYKAILSKQNIAYLQAQALQVTGIFVLMARNVCCNGVSSQQRHTGGAERNAIHASEREVGECAFVLLW